MANSHFGNLGDVWKHLVLAEVLEREPPRWYAETHAGSAAYLLNRDPQREFGIWRFLTAAPRSAELARSRYYAIAGSSASASPATYPGSPLLAMTILGNSSSYLLCDLDPGSAADLRSRSRQLGLRHCEVAGADGMAAVAAYLARGEGGGDGLVHVDPFEPDAAGPAGESALECAAGVADSGSALLFWYAAGEGQAAEPDGAPARLRALTDAPLWCGEVTVVTRDASARDVRRAATPGVVGVVLAHVQPATASACAALGQALAEAYAGATLPAGPPASLTFTSRWLPASGRTFAEGSQG
jgi:23S rRNA A2030 N6-methylase RlmJ